jgi:predicted porin
MARAVKGAPGGAGRRPVSQGINADWFDIMKSTVITISAAVLSTLISVSAGPVVAAPVPVEKKDYGSFSGRIQNLSMYRDIELAGKGYGYNSTLGLVLEYHSPEFGGFDLGLAYNYAFTLFEGGKPALLANDDINVLNEAWLRYSFGDSEIVAGRKVHNTEVFRTDDFRQKARAVEGLQFTTKAIPDTTLTVGHAVRLSSWIDAGKRWYFNDFGNVFGAGYETDGVTWAEALYTGCDGWEIALFDAYAWDVANLIGTRIQYDITDDARLIAYYRHEGDVGRAMSRQSDAYGLSYQQKVGKVTIEPGFFAVHGANLQFQELTTGINHPLGASMIICSCQFDGGARTAYIKATTKVGKVTLYGLYNYTWHDKNPFDGQEANLVIKYPVTDCFTVCFKGGIGYRDQRVGNNTTSVDGRLFITYTF